jgi:hypothetical protein
LGKILRMRCTLMFFLIGLSLTASAQLSLGGRYGYGAFGVSFEPPSLDSLQKPFMQSQIGAVLVFNNVSNMGLQVELNLADKGWYESADSIKGAYFKRTLQYVEVPVLSHFEITQSKLRPIIIAGPYLGWLLSDKTDSANWQRAVDRYNKYNHYSQPVHNLSLGIKLGLGLRYNISTRLAIYTEARIDLSLAGNSNIFIDRPDGIQVSRLTEVSGCLGVVYHIFPQSKITVKEGYKPKQDGFETPD